MTEKQTQAQAEFAPAEKRTQHKQILDTIEKQGFITKWGAIYDLHLHCSKLSTRIGEIERRAGKTFSRERMYQTDSTGRRYFTGLKYSLPKGATINDFR